jgi:hypothetical protein
MKPSGGKRRRRRRNRRSCCNRRYRCFSTPTLRVHTRSREELPYKGGTYVALPRRGCRGVHRHNGASPQVYGNSSRPCLPEYGTFGGIATHAPTRSDRSLREGKVGRESMQSLPCKGVTKDKGRRRHPSFGPPRRKNPRSRATAYPRSACHELDMVFSL